MRVFLREDHDEVLKIWRKARVKGLDLIHVDAHIDFVMYHARDPLEIFHSAASLKELKAGLEYTLAYLDYEKDLNKQTDIGNYIYPAMREGMVKDFWWVVPGDVRTFDKNFRQLKNIFCRSFGEQKIKVMHKAPGLACVESWGRRFWACVLDTLPVFEQEVLLDIDTDFLVVPDISKADNTCDIGKRRPWIRPQELKDKLAEKIKKSAVTTIAYSTRGGFTPMAFRHFGDELAYHFDRSRFAARHRRAQRAADHFRDFLRAGKRRDYWSSVVFEPAYRSEDNNFGSLYLGKNRISLAQKELKNILRVDPHNPAALKNMAVVFLERKNYAKAIACFKAVLTQKGIGKDLRQQAVLGLAQVYLKRKRFKEAQGLLVWHKRLAPLFGQTRYHLARIYAAQKDYWLAAQNYRHSLRLGFGGLDLVEKLLKLAFKLYGEQKRGIIEYAKICLAGFKARTGTNKKWKVKIKSLERLLQEVTTDVR